MKTMLLLFLCVLSVSLAFAQPLEGPFTVLSSDGEHGFSLPNVISRTSVTADVFVVDSVNSIPTGYHGKYLLNEHRWEDGLQGIFSWGGWQAKFSEAVLRDDGGWAYLAYFETENGSALIRHRTLMLAGRDTTLWAVLDSGSQVWSTGSGFLNTNHSLRLRPGGGYAVSWIRNSFIDLGGWFSPLYEPRVTLLDSRLHQDTAYSCCNVSTDLDGSMALLTAPCTRDSMTAIFRSPADVNAYALTFPSAVELPRRSVGASLYPADFRRTNGGRFLALALEEGANPARVIQVDTSGSSTDLGPLNLNPDPRAIAWNADFGFAALEVQPAGLKLARVDTMGVSVQPVGDIAHAEPGYAIAEASIAISSDGLVVTVWTEVPISPTGPQVLRLATIGWATHLNADNPAATLRPSSFALSAFPNPFNPTTTIHFEVARAGGVSLKVFDLLGCEVATLVDARMEVGAREVTWDATRFSSGVYFARLESGGNMQVQMLLIVR